MTEPLSLLLDLIAGVVLGSVFFGGLWWTVRKCVSAQQPALWFFGGGLLRMTLVLAGFYFVARGRWEGLLACLIGFVIARVIVTRLTHFQVIGAAEKPTQWAKEASHAPYSR